jgi:hypothetical protein
MRNIGSSLDHTLQSRAQNLHGNAAQLERQHARLEQETAGLRRETEKLRKVADEGARRVKELGNVQNWAEVLERDFLVLGELVRLVRKGDRERGWDGGEEGWETSSGSGSWSGSEDGSEGGGGGEPVGDGERRSTDNIDEPPLSRELGLPSQNAVKGDEGDQMIVDKTASEPEPQKAGDDDHAMKGTGDAAADPTGEEISPVNGHQELKAVHGDAAAHIIDEGAQAAPGRPKAVDDDGDTAMDGAEAYDGEDTGKGKEPEDQHQVIIGEDPSAAATTSSGSASTADLSSGSIHTATATTS